MSPVRMKRLPSGECHSAAAVRSGLAVIGGHHRLRMADDLAGLAARQFAAGIVDDANVVGVAGSADGVQLVGIRVRLEDAGAAALGHAVVLGEATGPARQHLALECWRERRAGGELHAERRQVVVRELRQRQDALVLHRHQHRVRGAVLLGELEVAGGIELRHQHDRAAAGERGEERHQRGVRVQRRGEQRDRVRSVAAGGSAQHVHPAHAMRLHDALRRAGRARRVDDVERRVRLDRDRTRRRAGRREPVRQRTTRRAVPERNALRRRLRGHERTRCGIDEQPAGAAIAQHRCEVGRRDRGRQRCDRRARPQSPKEQRGVRRRRLAAQRDGVAGARAIALQGRRDAVHQGIELRVAHSFVALDQCGLLRPRGGVLPDEIGEVAEGPVEHDRRGG